MDFYYVNICKHEHVKTWQGYGAISCLKLVLNRLKETKGCTPIYTPLGTQLKEAFMCASSTEVSWEPSLLKIDYELIKTELKVNWDLTQSWLGIN
jgi:hypothetical protein